MHPTQASIEIKTFEHFQQLMCRDYSRIEWQRGGNDRINGHLSYSQFGALGVGDISFNATGIQFVTRSSAEIRKDPRDDFLLMLMIAGHGTFLQNERECSLHPGDIVLWHQARPWSLAMTENVHVVPVNIPYALIASRMKMADRLTARAVHENSKMGALAGAVLHQILKLGSVNDSAASALSSSATDILTTALEYELGGAPYPSHPQVDRLDQVKRYILANLHDANLDIERIAKAQNIAPRTLNRLFVSEGSTPIRWLWQQRLAASYRALLEGNSHQVTTVAFNHGFNDSSHFSRAFKKTFGRSPHTVKSR